MKFLLEVSRLQSKRLAIGQLTTCKDTHINMYALKAL